MSGYLSNLISRTFEPQVAVQPRLAPLFGPLGPELERSTAKLPLEEESLVEADPSIARTPIRLDMPAEPPAINRAAARQVTPTEPGKPAPAPIDDIDTLPGNTAHRLSSPDPNLRSESLPSAPRLDEPARQVMSPPKGEPPALDAKPVTAKPPAAIELETKVLQVVELRAVEPTPMSTPRAEMRSPDVAPAAKAPSESILRSDVERYYSRNQPPDSKEHDGPRPSAVGQVGQRVTAFPSRRAEANRPQAPTPRIIPARSELRVAAQQPPAPAPQSTIHVTIGRIEVRAATPAQPNKPARAPSAVLGLEEYLRQRSGGRRP
jgi:hypothetical protein